MIRNLVFMLSVALLGACGGAAPVASNQQPEPAQSSGSPQNLETVTAHSADGRIKPKLQESPAPADENGKSHWTRGGTPIDTTVYDAEIKAAETKVKASPSDAALKKSLSEAYYKRAVALTEARQYASALGDYRRAVKYDPSNTDAKEWVDKIIIIYEGMNKSYPKEGEEPPPLEYKAGKV